MQLKESDIQELREKTLKQQKGKCAICHVKIEEGQERMDHNHITGRCRGVLCHLCNVTEGALKHKFNKSGLRKHFPEQEDYYRWLRQLIDYLEGEETEYIHPQHRLKKIKKFMKSPKYNKIKVLEQLGEKMPKKITSLDLVKMYRKLI